MTLINELINSIPDEKLSERCVLGHPSSPSGSDRLAWCGLRAHRSAFRAKLLSETRLEGAIDVRTAPFLLRLKGRAVQCPMRFACCLLAFVPRSTCVTCWTSARSSTTWPPSSKSLMVRIGVTSSTCSWRALDLFAPAGAWLLLDAFAFVCVRAAQWSKDKVQTTLDGIDYRSALALRATGSDEYQCCV